MVIKPHISRGGGGGGGFGVYDDWCIKLVLPFGNLRKASSDLRNPICRQSSEYLGWLSAAVRNLHISSEIFFVISINV